MIFLVVFLLAATQTFNLLNVSLILSKKLLKIVNKMG